MVGALAAVIILLCMVAVFANRAKPRDVSSLPAPSEDVKRLIREGSKVAAIRAYRKQTGATLLEAHHVVGRHAA